MRISRRSFVATGLAAATLVPRRTLAQMSDNEKALYEAAKSEGELTWYSSHYTSETSERIGRAFTAKYPGVKWNVVGTTAQAAFHRWTEASRPVVPNCVITGATRTAHC